MEARELLIITTSGKRYGFPVPASWQLSTANVVRQILAKDHLVVESAAGYDVFLNTATIETIQEGDE
jgi:hypothetical protein